MCKTLSIFRAAEGESTIGSAMRSPEFHFRHCSPRGKISFVGDIPPPPSYFLRGNMDVSIGDGTSVSHITTLLRAWSSGDSGALDQLTPLVYGELYRLAQCQMAREKPDHILQNTALINEIYLQLSNLREVDWQSRSHFFAVCSQLMRHTLAGYARSRLYLKRGGDAQQVPFDENLGVPDRDPGSVLIALDDALHDLAAFDERMSQVVQLRFFGGFSIKETAEALKISERTARREWEAAKVWLVRELKRGEKSGK
jgi:RNA polymerase sigma factor (TIGR02999 family)